MNRGQLIASVSAKLGLTNEAGHEERLLMENWANDGVVEVLLKTQCFVTFGDMALTIGQTDYRTDADILVALDASVPGSQAHRWRVVNLDEIIDRKNLTTTADGASWIAVEGDLMIVFPAPTTATSLRLYYVPRPDPMTADANDPSAEAFGGVRAEYHRAIEYYMLWQGAEYDEKKATPLSAQDYMKMFQDECSNVRTRKRHAGGRRMAPGRIGYPGGNLPRRNDIYPVR